MSAAFEKEPAPRALLIGRSPAVMESVLAELRELGVATIGDTDPDRAGDRPDAGSFSVVAIGRGVSGSARMRLREKFLARNPSVKLMDVLLHETAARVSGALQGQDPQGVDLGAYFARIGYAGPIGPSLETLRTLVAAHLAAIPFENLDVLSGRGVDISPQAVDAKLIGARRGGYCYEQNGLFKRVLAALGFEVDALMARVLMNQKAGKPLARSHMTLKVTIDDAAYLADVGFGGFTPPAPLRIGEAAPQATPHERYRLVPFGPLTRLEAEVDGAFAPMYEFSGEQQIPADYGPANWFTSTHPSSFFTKAPALARTTAEARCTLWGTRLTIRRPGAEPERRDLSPTEAEAAIEQIFAIAFDPTWRPILERAAQG